MLIFLNVSTSEAAMQHLETKRERMESQNLSTKSSASLYPKIHESFLKGDYLGVDRLSKSFLQDSQDPAHRQDVLYLQALSLMKLNRAFEARVKLRVLENTFTSLDKKASASASVEDSYYYAGDEALAFASFKATFEKYPNSSQSSYVLYKLLELAEKSKRQDESIFYKASLLRDYAASRQAQDARIHFAAVPEIDRLGSALRQISFEEQPFFAVQVGSFSREKNARSLMKELLDKHFEAYLEKDRKNRMVRVRVGRCPSREEAGKLSERLKEEGYPTKIYP